MNEKEWFSLEWIRKLVLQNDMKCKWLTATNNKFRYIRSDLRICILSSRYLVLSCIDVTCPKVLVNPYSMLLARCPLPIVQGPMPDTRCPFPTTSYRLCNISKRQVCPCCTPFHAKCYTVPTDITREHRGSALISALITPVPTPYPAFLRIMRMANSRLVEF